MASARRGGSAAPNAASSSAAQAMTEPPTWWAYFRRASGASFPATMPFETSSEASPPELRTVQASCFSRNIWSMKASLLFTAAARRIETFSSVSSSAVPSDMYSLASPSRRAAFGFLNASMLSACSAKKVLARRCNSGNKVLRSGKSIVSRIARADFSAGTSASRIPRRYFSASASIVSAELRLRTVDERSVRRLCIAVKALPAASATAAMRPVEARRFHEAQALMATRTTTTRPATPTTDFNRAETESRDSMHFLPEFARRMKCGR